MKSLGILFGMLLFATSINAQAQSITITPRNNGPYCRGESFQIEYSATGLVFNSTNVFRVQLSNSSGSFASPTLIGSRTSTIPSGIISVTIPTGAAAGTAYRVRVVSTNPAFTGSDNGRNLEVLAAGNCSTSWTTTGNGGITTTNFIGTLNPARLAFRVFGKSAGIIDSAVSSPSTFGSFFGGSGSTALGYQALSKNSYTFPEICNPCLPSGFLNTAFGYKSLSLNTFGNNNTGVGGQSLINNVGGDGNTGIGFNALSSNTSGDNNTALGNGANVSSGALTNATAIGNGATVNASNKVRIGNTAIAVIEGQVGFTSDGRFKNNISEDAPGLDLVMKLKPVTYNFQYNKFSEFLREKNADKAILQQRESKREVGFIAQDVEKACKDLGLDVSNIVHRPESEIDNYSLAYQNLVVPLVKAVQEQQEQINALKSEVEALKKSQIRSGMVTVSVENGQENALLGQNIPNPFENNTIIPFRIPADCRDASIVISHTGTGQILKVIPISCKETQVSVDAGTLAGGSYTYALYVNGKTVDSKRMILAK